MKAVADDRLVDWLGRSGPLLVEVLRRPDIVGIFETLLRYLFAADSTVSFEAIRSTIDRSSTAQTKDRVMSIAEELIAKGRHEGRQEGRHEGALIGRIQGFQELLGLPISQTSDLADKPASELLRLLDDLRTRLNNRS